MTFYSLGITYNTDTKNSYKVLLDDGTLEKIVILDIYLIKGNWYLDISDTEENLLMGTLINPYTDLFKLCKTRYNDFPNVALRALPINMNGIDKPFNEETAGVQQDLLVIVDE